MSRRRASLEWIDAQHQEMRRLLVEWAKINTGSYNLPGLERFISSAADEFASLGGASERIALRPHEVIDAAGCVVHRPLGECLLVRKRPDAPLRVLLNIHVDTVYPASDAFQDVEAVDVGTLRGPGVADAKGGLVVMLFALRALERSGLAGSIGWDVLLNPDEEIGSPGSTPVLMERCAGHCMGLVFEPALPEGALAGARGGSGNFTALLRGRAAHAGRDFHLGRNALHALADFVVKLNELNDELPGVSVNVAKVDGGGPLNIVPDLAIGRFNVRVKTADDQQAATERIARLAAEITRRDGISLELRGGFYAPPKPLNEGSRRLMSWIEACGKELGVPIQWRETGGVSDGNRLAAAGLPVVDTLGVRGGKIHSHQEYVLLDSLTERAKLSALLLMKLATGEFQP